MYDEIMKLEAERMKINEKLENELNELIYTGASIYDLVYFVDDPIDLLDLGFDESELEDLELY